MLLHFIWRVENFFANVTYVEFDISITFGPLLLFWGFDKILKIMEIYSTQNLFILFIDSKYDR